MPENKKIQAINENKDTISDDISGGNFLADGNRKPVQDPCNPAELHGTDMLDGPLASSILKFSVPLMFSNILQVFFNLADVAVAGKFAGPIALGAVGSTTILVMLTTGILLGTGSGINAVAALYLGAGDRDRVHKTVQTSFVICFIAGILLLVSGLLFSGKILLLLGTKEELIQGAEIYLKIYLLGSPGLALYNYGNALLNACGDTKTPLKFLTAAGIINIILNILFVVVFHLDVAGVALASIISQYVSGILILRFLMKSDTEYHLSLRNLQVSSEIAGKILSIAIPTAIQYSLFAVANLYIQSAVNSFDHVVVEGNSAAANADNLVYDLMAAFYTACTSFTAQNLGAGKYDRIRKIYFYTTLFPAVLAFVLGGLLILFRTQFLSLFTSDADVIRYGTVRLVIMGASYFVSAFMDNASAAARGLGKSIAPTAITILGTVVYRIIWVCTVFRHFHTLPSLYLVFVTAWIFTAIMGNIYYFHTYREIKKQD